MAAGSTGRAAGSKFRGIPRVEPACWLPPDGGASDLDVSAGAGDRTLGGRTGRHACKELLGPLPHDDDFVVDEPVVKLEPLDEQLRSLLRVHQDR